MVASNGAFESGRADKQRGFGLRPWRRAAQRERYAARGAGWHSSRDGHHRLNSGRSKSDGVD